MHRKVLRNRPIALLASLALLATLFADAGVMLRSQQDDLGYAGVGVLSHPWRVEASAPSKTWESPSLHQSSLKKAAPATTTALDRAINPATTASIDHPGHIGPDSPQRPRLVALRAPPHRSTSL